MTNQINPELLAILACPACKSKVIFNQERIVCTNSACGLRYPVRDGIPVMLIEEAQKPR